MKMDLSTHFTLEEFTHSEKAEEYEIDNTPNDEQIENMKSLCENALEQIRAELILKYNRPVYIHINSGFRCLTLNSKVGGAVNSQHTKGEAADSTASGLTVEEYYEDVKELVKDGKVVVDQCIMEIAIKKDGTISKWVHVSSKKNGANRNEFLFGKKENGKTVYSHEPIA